MNKPQAHGNLIPVRDYARTVISRRGKPVSVQYIYKLISQYKNPYHKRSRLDFNFHEIDKTIWIEV